MYFFLIKNIYMCQLYANIIAINQESRNCHKNYYPDHLFKSK